VMFELEKQEAGLEEDKIIVMSYPWISPIIVSFYYGVRHPLSYQNYQLPWCPITMVSDTLKTWCQTFLLSWC